MSKRINDYLDKHRIEETLFKNERSAIIFSLAYPFTIARTKNALYMNGRKIISYFDTENNNSNPT